MVADGAVVVHVGGMCSEASSGTSTPVDLDFMLGTPVSPLTPRSGRGSPRSGRRV